MAISIFELFTIGIGPSSSHTVGPMRAALSFIQKIKDKDLFDAVMRIKVELYGSLALTGKGHGTDLAIIMGLEGETPEHIDPSTIPSRVGAIREGAPLNFSGLKSFPFIERNDFIFHKDKQLPKHPNGMRFTAYSEDNRELLSQVYYSIGGGFVLEHEEVSPEGHICSEIHKIPFPFETCDQLLRICALHGMTIQDVMMKNEMTWRTESEIREGLLNIWKAMKDSVERGCHTSGILPGGLNTKRRAQDILKSLEKTEKESETSPSSVFKWVSLWALAVNEENAAGGRVVTAPTNGASGIIPAILKFYEKFTPNPTEEGIITCLLNAGAIGILYKVGASISAAEMGCMGEVGVACSMAAAGLTAALNGSIFQIENAAEIGMEHNLGLTCDPVMGLVQIPCIERNAMGAVKAINACLLALESDGKSHRVSLDQVIDTMRETGHAMEGIFKETSLGGLAVNVPEC